MESSSLALMPVIGLCWDPLVGELPVGPMALGPLGKSCMETVNVLPRQSVSCQVPLGSS